MLASKHLARTAAAALGIGFAVFSGAGDASAYCRTATCPGGVTGTDCNPSSPQDCTDGIALFWSSPCVGFDLQQDASVRTSLSTATAVFTQAFATWANAACVGGGHPRIEAVDLGPVVCDQHEYNQNSGNANIILFRDDGWPHEGQGDVLALTTVTYNLDTGEIYDADIEMNSTQGQFTTSPTNVIDDLPSIATHETGHFLGLAHTPDMDATMFASYTQGTTSLRNLSPDDIAAMCAVYPPGPAIPQSCDPTPRHGFSSQCGSATPVATAACCAIAPGAPDPSPNRALLLGALGLLVTLRRVAKRRRR